MKLFVFDGAYCVFASLGIHEKDVLSRMDDFLKILKLLGRIIWNFLCKQIKHKFFKKIFL